ncbi:ES1 protein homolog, mitochondrial-like [Trichogramma pretiosum]|uniref:ES1 protein homolog, mitochondrial-like n=1 Tax=Trichogramma pretiosum TaxID=7493 RepID=UPI0006C9924D|nr:ES1 protein homolog, mitochondrial-like [Trichogramma pretiosum]
MWSRFESLRRLSANVSKLAATRNATAPASNLLLHTSAACQDIPFREDSEIERDVRRFLGKRPHEPPSVLVILCGCGDTKGSSTLETESLIVNLHRYGLYAAVFAPSQLIRREWDFDANSFKSHELQARRAHVESARLVLGHSVKEFHNLKDFRQYDALVIPGGAGVGFVLSDFLVRGDAGHVDPYVRSAIQDFHSNKKPIGTISYAGLLVAKVIPGVQITMRRPANTDEDWSHDLPQKAIDLARAWHAEHMEVPTSEIWKDKLATVYSTPGFTIRTDPRSAVFDGIGKLVEAIKRKID